MTINWQEILYVGLIVLLVIVVGMVLFMAVTEMPVYGQVDNPTNNYTMRRYVDVGVQESGGYNHVTNILLDYRAYDTILETTVIYTAVICIMVLWGVKSTE